MRRRDFIAILIILALFIPVSAREIAGQDISSKPRFALVPLLNQTDVNAARESVEMLIARELEKRCALAPADSLRNLMRTNRLRLVGSVNSIAAAKLHAGLALDYVVTGGIEIYQSGELPEFSFCLRVYNCVENCIVWMSCISASGLDYAGILKIGETSSLDKVVTLVIRDIMKDFDSHWDGQQFARPKSGRRAEELLHGGKVAVIPCDHTTIHPRAGEFVSDLLLAQLWKQGYAVAEPGEVTRVLTREGELSFGAASERGMQFLSDSLDVEVVVSGTVFEFSSLKGQLSQAGPAVALSLRLVDPVSGRVISAVDDQRNGARVGTLFGAGREYAIGNTANALLEDMWRRLVKERRKMESENQNGNHETVLR
jgi:hypothetical protein